MSDTVLVFPGQGSQYPGMGRELGVCGPEARALVPRAEEHTGLPLGELMTRADAHTIADPEVAQLLVFVLSSALLKQFETVSGSPAAAVAGHSLGEYTALVAAGCLEWDTAVSLVAARGRAMAAAARRAPGGMAAVVALPAPTVEQLCEEASREDRGVAVVANYNSHRQVTVSGNVAAVDFVVERAREAGALRARRLPVGGAYHSPLMTTAEDELRPHLRATEPAEPRVPLISGVTGAPVGRLEAYGEQLRRQITSPVRWETAVKRLLDEGSTTFIEVGPGRVLTGLGRDIARGATHLTVHQSLRQDTGSPSTADTPKERELLR